MNRHSNFQLFPPPVLSYKKSWTKVILKNRHDTITRIGVVLSYSKQATVN